MSKFLKHLERSYKFRIYFDPHDLWIGLYWKKSWWGDFIYFLDFFICPFPCLIIQITRHKTTTTGRSGATRQAGVIPVSLSLSDTASLEPQRSDTLGGIETTRPPNLDPNSKHIQP